MGCSGCTPNSLFIVTVTSLQTQACCILVYSQAISSMAMSLALPSLQAFSLAVCTSLSDKCISTSQFTKCPPHMHMVMLSSEAQNRSSAAHTRHVVAEHGGHNAGRWLPISSGPAPAVAQAASAGLGQGQPGCCDCNVLGDAVLPADRASCMHTAAKHTGRLQLEQSGKCRPSSQHRLAGELPPGTMHTANHC